LKTMTIELTFEEVGMLKTLLRNEVQDTQSNKAAELYTNIYRKVMKAQDTYHVGGPAAHRLDDAPGA
jgi:hypothetical protein